MTKCLGRVELKLDGGMLLTQKVKQTLIYLPHLAGTAEKAPSNWNKKLTLGASLGASASETDITISGTVLSKHYSDLMQLVTSDTLALMNKSLN